MSSKTSLSGFNAGNFLPEKPSSKHALQPETRQTAWQRWEMRSIAEELPPNLIIPATKAWDGVTDRRAATAMRSGAEPWDGLTERRVAKISEPVPEAVQPIVVIDEAELNRLRLEAKKAGEAEGYEKGFALGQAVGQAAGAAAVQAQTGQLLALAMALPAALRIAENSVADDLLALALDIAKKVLGQSLTLDPKAILPWVRELLQAEPVLSGAPQLLLHPDDAALVKEHLADDLKVAGWRIRVDAHVARGGCRVLAAGGERDATLETRWERVAATLTRHESTATPQGPG
jgi:flagellar assembly protein FliH